MSLPAYIKLSDLAGHIEDAIDAAFERQYVWILAEVSNVKHYAAKHHYYFDLVEKAEGSATLACLSACAWRPGTETIKNFEVITGQAFANGLQVLVQVCVSYHRVHGLKLVLYDINPEFTIGNLYRQRQETLERLLRECPEEVRFEDGIYLTKNKRAALKPVIQSIAVISSSTAAGYEDFTRALHGNSYGFTFCVHSYYTQVQGRDADQRMVECLIDIYKSGRPYDAVILVRGGGSQMDLLTYDSFRLARAVAKFPIPVITGIGHLRDVSIVDLMAHTHEITPSRAAAFIIGHNKRFADDLESLQQELRHCTRRLLSGHKEDLFNLNNAIAHGAKDYLCARRAMLNRSNNTAVHKSKAMLYGHSREMTQLSGRLAARPTAVLADRANGLGRLTEQVKIFGKKYVTLRRREIDGLGMLFRFLSPERTLQRGFAIISQQGKGLKNADHLEPGAEVLIRMTGAVLSATINEKTQPDGSTDDL